jgi:peptidyl-prolyl cis-trans isomerase SurA
MKRSLKLVLTAALLLGSQQALAQTRELGGTGELLDGVAAIVDEGIVLKSQLDQKVAVIINNIQNSMAQLPPAQRRPVPPLSIIEEQVLEQLIMVELQLQQARRFGITVGDDALNQGIASVAQNAGIPLEQLPAALAEEGLDYVAFRNETRDQMIVDQLHQRAILSNIVVGPREMDLCLAETTTTAAAEIDYLASHLLIGISSTATRTEINQAREQVEDIHQKLESDENFAELALTYSDGQTALEGGSLGWRKGAQLPTLFADVIIGLGEGQHSEPIQSASGFHIVRLDASRGAQPVMVDQLRIRHILVEPNEVMDDSAVLQRLRGIHEQILNGGDFAVFAQTVSDDAASGADGGDMGWTGPGIFVPEFEAVVAGLEIGELSEPFKTQYGWHIAEVLDSRSYDTTEELKTQRCVQQIRGTKLEEERTLWLSRLRDESFVEVRM